MVAACSLYSRPSISASQLASMMLPLTPTVLHAVVAVAADDKHARARGRRQMAVDDAHLVILQLRSRRSPGKTAATPCATRASSAFTGPSPSATVYSGSSPTRSFTVASQVSYAPLPARR